MAHQRRAPNDAEDSLTAGVGVMATAIVAGGFDHMGEDDGNDDGGEDEGVCATGQEVTGRWTRKEHELFLEALKRYGKEWKKVAAAVKTRTVVQTRTHAQKYFQKVTKIGGNPVGRPYSQQQQMIQFPQSAYARYQQQHYSNLPAPASGAGAGPGSGSGASMYAPEEGYEGVLSGNKRSSGRRTRRLYDSGSRRPQSGHGEGADDFYYQEYDDAQGGYEELPPTATPLAKAMVMSVGRLPEDFPQPSPAACGKRKAAELTAAQVLTASSGRASEKNEQDDMDGAQVLSTLKGAPLRPGEIVRRARAITVPGLSIINPDNLEDASPSGEPPGTPWDRELGAYAAKERQAMPAGLATPSEQRDFLGKVLSYIRAGDLGELKQILQAAEASAASLVGVSVTALDLQDGLASPQAQKRTASSSSSSSSSASASAASAAKEAAGAAGAAGAATAAAGAAAGGSGQKANPSTIVSRTLNRLGPHGSTCLMEACSLPPTEHDQALVLGICKELMEHGASASILDSAGASCLHRAALSGYDKVGRFLLNKGCPVNAVSSDGNAAVHIAALAGHALFLEMLADFGANCHLRNSNARAALDLAGADPATAPHRDELRRVMLSVEPRLRTLILYHEDCLEHTTRKAADWEGPDRLVDIMQRLQDRALFPEHELEISMQFDKAPVELLSRVHSPEYIAFVDKLSKKLQQEKDAEARGGQREGEAVAFTPHLQRAMIMRQMSSEVKVGEHSDTSFSAGTLQAARRAAGAVAHAVDRVLLGRNRNAFCVVRPPGHHAGYRGLLDGAKSCGFCIFNSVAAGAVHALEGHNNCERVAVIDLDIHHGNGTEDIIRRYPNPSRLLFFSLHLYDREQEHGQGQGQGQEQEQGQEQGQGASEAYEFFPGSGSSDDTVHNIINVPIPPIWHASASASTGSPPGGSPAVSVSEVSGARVGREAYRQAITQRLLPALRAFNPSLILLSTGFDPVEGDVGNTKSGTADADAGMDLRPEDFAWTTSEILNVADICCSGRVVSVLEGGYGKYAEQSKNKRSQPSSQSAGGVAMDRGILATCAAAHVRSLVDPYKAWQGAATKSASVKLEL